MSGYTGKRARPAGTCIRCGQQIQTPYFSRDRKGDSHCLDASGVPECPRKPETLAQATAKGRADYKRVTGQE